MQKIAIILALIGQGAMPAAARQFQHITDPVILTRAECLKPYLSAAHAGAVGKDVIEALERDGCIKYLKGVYEIQANGPDQKDPDFLYATLRLDLVEMRKRDPKYQVEDIKVTPPIETGFVFRAQIPRSAAK
jgi:hypothetical protein